MNQGRDDFFSALYHDCDGLVELRALPSAVCRFFAPDDVASMTAFIAEHTHENIFNGIATRRSAAGGSLTNCLYLPALWCDIDFKDTPESDARTRIAKAPIQPSATIKSGDGLHLYFFIKECVDLSREAAEAKTMLRRLVPYFGADAQSAELARVLRVPETTNHKYEPPRLVTVEQCDPDRRYNLSDFDEWLPTLAEASRTDRAHVPLDGPIPVGQREQTIMRVLGGARRCGASAAGLRALAETENAHCVVPLTAHDLDRMAKSVARYEPDDLDVEALIASVKQERARSGQRTVTLLAASAITPRPVRWLWLDRVALGTLVMLGGREGIGKTILAYTLAADITRGRLPGVFHGQPRSVIVAATEDSWAHTIVPRLMAAGADLDRVYRVDVTTAEGVGTTLSLPRDLAALERVTNDVEAAAIILDPLLSRLDSTLDTHKDAEVRLGLEPLVKLADASDACVLGLIHVNKGTSADPLTLLMGSRAFAAVARSVLFAMVDPDDETKRLLGQPKNNLGRTDLPTLTFQINGVCVTETDEGQVWTGKLDWLGQADRSITEAVDAAAGSADDRSATSDAANWLSDYLASQGGQQDAAIVLQEGRKEGHSRNALYRARKRLRLISESEGFPRRAHWMLPAPVVPSLGESVKSGTNGTTGTTAPGDSPSCPISPINPSRTSPPARETTTGDPSPGEEYTMTERGPPETPLSLVLSEPSRHKNAGV